MFDAATLREELEAMEAKLRLTPNDHVLVNRFVNYARRLRQKEYEENGYVTARNSMTGY